MIVLITGANRGIGLEFVSQYAARGETVYAGCRRPEAATALMALRDQYGDRVRIVQLDVTDADSIASAIASIHTTTDSLDLLMNNAAIGIGEKLGEFTFDAGQAVLRANVLGPLIVSQAALPLLRHGTRKMIVSISSGAGSIASASAKAAGSLFHYSVSKAALNMVTRLLAADVKGEKIGAIAICPGWVRTDMGGPTAHLSPQESVASMLPVIDRLTVKDTGRFMSNDGRDAAW